MKRIGFACKISQPCSKRGIVAVDSMNFKTTTVAWLNRQPTNVAVAKLETLMAENLKALQNSIEFVAALPEQLRMFRIGSDLFPVYSHPQWSWFWKQTDIRAIIEKSLAATGSYAKEHCVRLSMHPGQFTCVVSDRSDVVRSSIEELEYHGDIIRWLGYGNQKLDFKLNIHLSGKLGVSGFLPAYTQMSNEVRNCLTLENDEYQQGVGDLVQLGKYAGIVLDIHHHLIKEHEYIRPSDLRIQQIIDSWQGVRPVIHYSQSREEYLSKLQDCLPTMEQMVAVAPKSKLRAHSDFYTNTHVNQWALEHWEWADIMCESKAKNLASQLLFESM